MLEPTILQVPVRGGDLTVARWGRGDTTVVAPHGITANHVSWAYVAEALGDDVTLLAPDLRGRGGSAGLPGPYGMATHADDCVAILDHLDIATAVMAGHSMGGFVAVTAGARHPDRLTALVLLDGGLPLPVPEGMDIDDVLLAVIGPAMQRLQMTFPSREAYRDHWRPHPALAGQWNEVVAAYVDYDVHDVDGAVRSKVDIDAIRADARDTLVDDGLTTALASIDLPMRFLRAPRGLMDADPLYPRDVVEHVARTTPALEAFELDDVNHYTLALSPQGAEQVATHVRLALEA